MKLRRRTPEQLQDESDAMELFAALGGFLAGTLPTVTDVAWYYPLAAGAVAVTAAMRRRQLEKRLRRIALLTEPPKEADQ